MSELGNAVGCSCLGSCRVGPTRHHEGGGGVLPRNRDFKESFKTPGTTEGNKRLAVVDYAHCKGMKGRFEQLGNATSPDGGGHFSYGAVHGAQYGAVQRPPSARHMLGFRDLCSAEQPLPPSTTERLAAGDLNLPKEANLILMARQVQLDNVIARAGI